MIQLFQGQRILHLGMREEEVELKVNLLMIENLVSILRWTINWRIYQLILEKVRLEILWALKFKMLQSIKIRTWMEHSQSSQMIKWILLSSKSQIIWKEQLNTNSSNMLYLENMRQKDQVQWGLKSWTLNSLTMRIYVHV